MSHQPLPLRHQTRVSFCSGTLCSDWMMSRLDCLNERESRMPSTAIQGSVISNLSIEATGCHCCFVYLWWKQEDLGKESRNLEVKINNPFISYSMLFHCWWLQMHAMLVCIWYRILKRSLLNSPDSSIIVTYYFNSRNEFPRAEFDK